MLKPLDHLKELIIKESKKKHPDFPEHAIPVNTFNNLKPEKREKKRIEKFLQLVPRCTAAIIENRGQVKIEKIHKVNGTMNKLSFIGSGMRKGIEDISAIINGKMVAIELKRKYKKGKDRQSKWQKQRQLEVESAGGEYWIVESFDDFYTKFMERHAQLLE
jgi:pheromone shutdown protein TraB